MKIDATFVRSAATADDFPCDGAPEIALVGRSNVGKSSLINALVRRRVARTSGAPGKTRLANIYRVERAAALYVVDLPGYGFARGGSAGFDEITGAFFGQERRACAPAGVAALLLVDARHPGLPADVDAWRWLATVVEERAIVATKVDKLARGERIRALRAIESVFAEPVQPVSAVTGEGLDDLWKVIDRLVKHQSRRPISSNSSSRSSRQPRAATAPRRRRS